MHISSALLVSIAVRWATPCHTLSVQHMIQDIIDVMCKQMDDHQQAIVVAFDCGRSAHSIVSRASTPAKHASRGKVFLSKEY